MTILNQNNCVLIIIDVQEKLLNAVFNPEQIKKNAEVLAKSASILEIPIYITEQYPKGLGRTIETVKGDKYYEKTSFNALLDIDFDFGERKQIIIFGIETHICVHQTVAALIEKGFDVTVVSDACGSRQKEHYIAGLDCMKVNGAKIKPTEMVLFELLKGAKHPNFKEIQSLIK